MTHAEFAEAWRKGKVRVEIDPAAAGAFVSARLLLAFVGIAVIGFGIALVLWGSLWPGIGVGAAGIALPRMIRRGARGFLLSQIATDAELFTASLRAGAIRIIGDEARSAPARPHDGS